ncbi:MAG TPA: hypothetical protein ENK18_26990 [Deltaproteobacteria bacterium]|nr:hypothetical protein [Deltaproteobacteria bacterium]
MTSPGYRVGLRPILLDDVDAIPGRINDPGDTHNFARTSGPIHRDEEPAILEDELRALAGSWGMLSG